MRLIRNPVAQFVAAGFLALVVVSTVTGQLSRQAAEEEAINDSLALAVVLARSVAEPAIPRGLVDGRVEAIDRFDRTARERLLVDNVERIKIWNKEGQIVYSDETRLIGDRYPLDGDEHAVLRGAESAAEFSDLSSRENRYEIGSGGLLEVYTQVVSPEGQPLLFEVYYSADDVAVREEVIFGEFRPIALGGLLVLLALTTPLLWVLTRRLATSAQDRERLLRAAVDASDAERRRIAQDLHDGVVQDLAGTSYALEAAAWRLSDDPKSAGLHEMAGSLRRSLRALRSLLVTIYPPDLDTYGLAAALDDLMAQAAGAGVASTVRVAELDGVDDDIVPLLWRVSQEAVRNALRHAGADRVDVSVSRHDGSVVLEVADDGRGFDPGEEGGRGHFGLRGLRDLIRAAGGTLNVQSVLGKGTTVRLEVSRP